MVDHVRCLENSALFLMQRRQQRLWITIVCELIPLTVTLRGKWSVVGDPDRSDFFDTIPASTFR